MTGINRRSFLHHLAAFSTVSSALSCHKLLATSLVSTTTTVNTPPAFATCHRDQNGAYGVDLFNDHFQKTDSMSIPMRGHDIVYHHNLLHLVVFPRRPGTEIHIFDSYSRKVITIIASQPKQHYYGHGVFSPDGKYLLATVNDYDKKRGLLSIFDVFDHYKLIDQIPTHGIGPHDIKFKTPQDLYIANGGLQTHPESGREILNIESMDSHICHLDWPSGRRKASYKSSFSKLSLRHMTINKSGQIAVGGQYQDKTPQDIPLVGLIDNGHLTWLPFPSQGGYLFQQYIGSISFDSSGEIIGATSPRGNIAIFWPLHNPNHYVTFKMLDCCGLSPTPHKNHFVMTNGMGKIMEIEVKNQVRILKAQTIPTISWDNHFITL